MTEKDRGEREMMALMRRLVEAVEYLAYSNEGDEAEDNPPGLSLSDVPHL